MPQRSGKNVNEFDAKVLARALAGHTSTAIAAELDVDKSTITRTLQRVLDEVAS